VHAVHLHIHIHVTVNPVNSGTPENTQINPSAAHEDTMRKTIETNLVELVGLKLLNRESRNLSRFVLERPSGEIITVQSYVAMRQPAKSNKAINFTIYDLNSEAFEEHWYAFAALSFSAPCAFSRQEIRMRFERKGKQVPDKTTITITPAVAEQNSIEQRRDVLCGRSHT
jgi:hypothetical protein